MVNMLSWSKAWFCKVLVSNRKQTCNSSFSVVWNPSHAIFAYNHRVQGINWEKNLSVTLDHFFELFGTSLPGTGTGTRWKYLSTAAVGHFGVLTSYFLLVSTIHRNLSNECPQMGQRSVRRPTVVSRGDWLKSQVAKSFAAPTLIWLETSDSTCSLLSFQQNFQHRSSFCPNVFLSFSSKRVRLDAEYYSIWTQSPRDKHKSSTCQWQHL